MSHMVIYRGSDGKPGYHQTDDIHDAVGFVEQMRNEQGVEHARIFRLEEVVFQYRPYYRVELSEGGTAFVESGPAEFASTNVGSEADTGEVVITANGGSTPANGEQATVGNGTQSATIAGDRSITSQATSVSGEPNEAGTKRGLFGR